MPSKAERVKFRLDRIGTGQGVGWFACVPEAGWGLPEGLAYLRDHPYDSFMHRHLLAVVGRLEEGEVRSLLGDGATGDPVLLTLAAERLVAKDRSGELATLLNGLDWPVLRAASPLIDIPWSRQNLPPGHFYWLRCFARNMMQHEPLPDPDAAEYDIPFDFETLAVWKGSVVRLHEQQTSPSCHNERKGGAVLKETCRALIRTLEGLGVLQGWESRTEATVSPYAVERPWRTAVVTTVERNRFELDVNQISYGRGFDIHQARISCLMEIVERFSAFATVGDGRCRGYRLEHALIKGTHDELEAAGVPVLDPDALTLEVPYAGDPLYWVDGERTVGGRSETVYVPAQLAFLFPNLDERNLTSGLSSTGFGAGQAPAAAKLSALLEVIERDAEKVVPFTEGGCFLMDFEGSEGAEILDAFARKGIVIQFRDMTSEFGIPCHQAFVVGPGGVVLKGSAAHLDGRCALLSALTEIPYPYPYWFGAMPPPPALPVRRLRDIPCYASGDAEADLRTIEKLLEANGLRPIYIDLTREDLGIPVYRALVPGLEMMTVYDRFTPLCSRQFGHYLHSTHGEKPNKGG